MNIIDLSKISRLPNYKIAAMNLTTGQRREIIELKNERMARSICNRRFAGKAR